MGDFVARKCAGYFAQGDTSVSARRLNDGENGSVHGGLDVGLGEVCGRGGGMAMPCEWSQSGTGAERAHHPERRPYRRSAPDSSRDGDHACSIGPLTLVYPKWIPGEHGPTGPIENFAGFFISGNGKPIKWERDKVDMFAFHVTVPDGVTKLDIKTDFLASAAQSGFSAGGSTSANLAMLSWNTLVVYPDGSDASAVMLTPSVTVPDGWRFGTALEKNGTAKGGTATFKTVSLETLIDSPVLAGKYFREVELAPEVTPKHYLDMAADGPEELQLSQEHIDEFDKLVRETGALYKSRHYSAYHFLVTLSDEVAHFGLGEHHQSSDDRVPAQTFVDDQRFTLEGLLLPHEFTHSWNGKYRRPAGLATNNYQKPMEGDLLWVYEGLTEYPWRRACGTQRHLDCGSI